MTGNYLSSVVKRRNFISHGGLLTSRIKTPKYDNVVGSLYLMYEKAFVKTLAEKGDWMIIQNALTNEGLLATQLMSLVKR